MQVSVRDGLHPRPHMRREQWASLDGQWYFAHDDADEGVAARWFDDPSAAAFDNAITVPYPPESPASGIGARGIHPVVWYRRRVACGVLAPAGHGLPGQRVLIHFGAVDYRAHVWLDGLLVAAHVGGQTPFTADITDAMAADSAEHVIVVRAEDDPFDAAQPRGKQDWHQTPHAIWYERTTGIWQSVWTEAVPAQHIAGLSWKTDPAVGIVGEITLAKAPLRPLAVRAVVSLAGEILAEGSTGIIAARTRLDVPIPALRHGEERESLLWSPETPTVLDVTVTLLGPDGQPVDSVDSYVGLRSVGVGAGSMLLNDRPYQIRAVLHQGYRPATHLASTGSGELKHEVSLIKAMGFNAVRVHQKAEDPRFLYWADRLGLLVWAEAAAAHEFSAAAIEQSTKEWLDVVVRDRSHPSVVVWTPFNESWGVPDIASDSAQQSYALALANLTRALDPGRLVISNDGWEHVGSDILGVHDYTVDPAQLRARYHDAVAIEDMIARRGPTGQRLTLSAEQARAHSAGAVPLMVTEFGGINLSGDGEDWGYALVGSDTEYAMLLDQLFEALRASPHVAGFCYTQFMDTAQETNGLLFADLTPKLPLELIRQIVTGTKDAS